MPILAAAAFLQDPASLANDVHWIAIADCVIAAIILLVFLALAIAGVVVFLQVKRIEAKVEALTGTVTKQAMPVIQKATALFDHLDPKIRAIADDLEPKIKSITSDAQHISSLVRSKADDAGESFAAINTTVKDTNAKTHAQITRVNGIVSHALTATEEITHTVAEGIRRPVRKIAETVMAVTVAFEDIGGKLPGVFSGLMAKMTNPKLSSRPAAVRTQVVTVPVPVPVPVPVAEPATPSSLPEYPSTKL